MLMAVNGGKMRTKGEYTLIRWILVLAGIFALPNSASAQGVSIQGHVTDPQGNVVIYAAVTLASLKIRSFNELSQATRVSFPSLG